MDGLLRSSHTHVSFVVVVLKTPMATCINTLVMIQMHGIAFTSRAKRVVENSTFATTTSKLTPINIFRYVLAFFRSIVLPVICIQFCMPMLYFSKLYFSSSSYSIVSFSLSSSRFFVCLLSPLSHTNHSTLALAIAHGHFYQVTHLMHSWTHVEYAYRFSNIANPSRQR